jgi:hypothetical protein
MKVKRLKEGFEYEFRVEKSISDPGGTTHFILTGPDGTKYLLPKDLYRNYGITLQSVIKCRVDKINCRGEIFLEPVNPYYKEGQSYEFKVTGHDVRTDLSGNEINVFQVTDIYKNIITVPCTTFPGRGTFVKLVVERISKGRLYLFRKDLKKRKESLVNGGGMS